ncbi:bromodomain and PHD finger containing, 3, isoform CRA_c [Ectocarpus siliculosus]|uniref:Bromodomain and PHD finger containing, 3, isoform CRA_c n=1 Tax=Ectocarpus siliculosus TaxID=2880 RepID=D7FMY3_ECTSI|nr:bromodomain and PHD finger containing, 3, isoform CRA_c [Ectocarpus siliculosus]|eukprot:CBJ30047.1 bromodomain and PHD finger containing, 3, isoform CRA_c [Ectocarpus siliculosus]
MMASSTKTREKKRERKGRTRGRSSSTAQHGWVQQVSAATATGEGGTRVDGRETEAAKTDNVICPQFRLHNLFCTGTATTTTTASDNDDNQSGQTSGKPTLGPRRKRPVKTEAGATREGRSMAPPRRSASACGGGGGKQVGFLDQTKDALVRSTQAVFGSDYDMDDDDFAFLEQLNGGRSAGGGSKMATGGVFPGEKGWAVSANLFEGMIERLERQESRARDTYSDTHRGATNVGSGLAGARETASRRSKGWKGKGKQPASRSGRSSGGNEEEEEEEDRAAVSDDQLLDVFRYWAKKREAYGGPMLRCFHPFIMKLWRRMEDPVREAEDQEEGKDPHASPEAFDTLKSFRQDLDKARLVVDCVKRREKLKRSAIRFANAYWKIFDDTMDAPRPRTPRPSQPKVTTTPAAPPAAPPLLSTSARPSTRRAARTTSGAVSNGVNVDGGGASGAGGSRSSGRAAAAAARAAVAALAAAESMEEDDYDAGVEEQEHGGEGEREEEVPLPPPLPAKLNGKAGGLAEQEQGWNTFAQLPTRAVAIPTSVRPSRQKKKGPGVQRGRNEVRERALQAVANPARGLFVHRGVAGGDVAVDRRHERLNSRAVELAEKDEAIPGAPQHQRSTNSSKPAGEAAPPVNAEEKIDERARRRERFNSASSAALAQQQASRRQQSNRQQSNRQQSSTRQSSRQQPSRQQPSRQQPSRMHRLREPQSEVVQADEEQDDSAEVQDLKAPTAAGRVSRRGGAGLRDGVAGRRGVRGANEPEKVNEARNNKTKKRRKAAFGPEDAEEESNNFDGATKGRQVTARGSERTKRRRLDENTNVENGALSNVRQHRARSSSASSSSSSDHPSISNTRASRSEAAVVVMEDVPMSPKAAVMLPGSKNHKTTSRSGRRKSRFANDGRSNRALARLS